MEKMIELLRSLLDKVPVFVAIYVLMRLEPRLTDSTTRLRR